MNAELEAKLPGITWNFSQNIRDNVMEALSGIKGDNSVKIIGPDLDKLETLADKTKNVLQQVPGIENVGIFHIRGQSHFEFRVDPEQVPAVGRADGRRQQRGDERPGRRGPLEHGRRRKAVRHLGPLAQAAAQQRSGHPRYPRRHRQQQRRAEPRARASIPSADRHTARRTPSNVGALGQHRQHHQQHAAAAACATWSRRSAKTAPRLPTANSRGHGASTIYREQGKRLIAIKFSVRGRDLAGAVAEAQAKTKDLFEAPYRAVWSGEFEEMQDAEARLMIIVPLSLAMIFILLYIAFRNVLDAMIVFSNVIDLSIGGVWALLADRDELQHLGGRRLHLDFRRRHHGRAVADFLLQPAALAGAAARRGDHARGPKSECGP